MHCTLPSATSANCTREGKKASPQQTFTPCKFRDPLCSFPTVQTQAQTGPDGGEQAQATRAGALPVPSPAPPSAQKPSHRGPIILVGSSLCSPPHRGYPPYSPTKLNHRSGRPRPDHPGRRVLTLHPTPPRPKPHLPSESAAPSSEAEQPKRAGDSRSPSPASPALGFQVQLRHAGRSRRNSPCCCGRDAQPLRGHPMY